MMTELFWLTLLVMVLGTGICESQTCSQIQSQYDDAKAGLQRDIQAVKRVGFEQTTDGIAEWIKAGEAVHDKAYDEFLNGLISYGLQSAHEGTQVWGSLTPPQANRFISELKSFGIDSTPWFDSLRQVAYTAGKPAATAPTKNLIEWTGHLADALEAVPKPQQDVGKTDLAVVALSFASGFIRYPEVGFSLAGWSFLTSLGWSVAGGAIVPARINQLANLSEQQLKALASVDQVIHHHVAEIQNAATQIATRGCNNQTDDACSNFNYRANLKIEKLNKCMQDDLACNSRCDPNHYLNGCYVACMHASEACQAAADSCP